MRIYILKRLALAVPTLFFVSLLVFTLIRLVPGDAAEMLMADVEFGASANEAVEVLREKLGLNRPFFVAYFDWVGDLLRGDLGHSLRTGDPISSELARRIPVTLELTGLAMLIALLIGVPAGIIAAMRADSPIDYLARGIAIAGLSIPNFWLGIMLILIPFQIWGYAPPLSYIGPSEDLWANLRMLAFPSLALGTSISAAVMRMVRTNLLEVVRADYIRTARAKGLPERVIIFRHALKNALIPSVEIVAAQFGRLLGGTVIIESIFALPGVGRSLVTSIFQRDYTELQALVLLAAATILVLNLIADLIYAWLDPRIRYA